MVDDGSTDRTFETMKSLAASHQNIRIVRHDSNLGGGAARNTGVAHSDGEIIFCLDSDDMLAPDFLGRMTRYWMEKKCDGVGISTSIKFRYKNLSDVAYVTAFEDPGETVRIESLLDSSACSLYSTFLITRAAFNYVGGYPTSHAFDTQGMAFRFLCNGMTAYTCPGSVYYHRVDFHESYYLREHRALRSQWNMFKVLSEFLYVFREHIQEMILDHDLFAGDTRGGILDELRVANARQSVFREDFREMARLGRDGVAHMLEGSTSKFDQYWLGTYHLSKGSHRQAMHAFVRALEGGFAHRAIYGQLLETALGVSGNRTAASISVGNLAYYVNDSRRSAGSSEPPLSRYQRLENSLVRSRHLRVLGMMMQGLRLLLRGLARGRGA